MASKRNALVIFVLFMAFGCSRGQSVERRDENTAIDANHLPDNRAEVCVCEECPEQIECSPCADAPRNPFAGRYNVDSITLFYPDAGYFIYRSILRDNCRHVLGNVNFEEGNEYERPFGAQIDVFEGCGEEAENIFTISMVGVYSFDRRNVFIINEDEGLARYTFEVYEEGRDEYVVELDNPLAEWSSEPTAEFIVLRRPR